MGDALPMIARCAEGQRNLDTVCPWFVETERDHPLTECEGLQLFWSGLNLILWNGRTHAPILTLKDDVEDNDVENMP